MSRARDLSRLSNPTNFTADGTTGRVGLGSENPTAKLNVAGIVSATAFYGDGSNLEGVASAGLGTALSDSGPGSVIYYTDKILGIAGNITVDVPDASNSNVAYTQYEEISVESGIDFIVADGDDFVPDILGLSTAGTTPLSGAGGRVRADNFTNKAGTGAPTFPSGVNVVGLVSATTGSFSGNVSVGGTLTYEDVTNIDSVGLITARKGIIATGVVTATSFSGSGANLTGIDAAPSFSGIASGSLSNGQTVIITSDGKVTGITRTDTPVPIAGSTGVFEDGSVSGASLRGVYDPDSGRVVVVYADAGQSNNGKAAAGLVSSDGTIAFGSPAQWHGGSTENVGIAYDTANDRIVVCGRDNGAANAIYNVGSLSGSTITFGSYGNLSTDGCREVKVSYDTNADRVLFIYQVGTGSAGKCRAGEVSGLTVSLGTEATFESSGIIPNQSSVTYHAAAQKHVITYTENSNYDGRAKVATIDPSDNSVTFGTHGTFHSATNVTDSNSVYDPDNARVVITFLADSVINAIVGQVSGTNITFGPKNVIFNANAYTLDSTYDTTNNKVILSFRNAASPYDGKFCIGTIDTSDNSITIASTTSSTGSVAATRQGVTYSPTTDHIVFLYNDGSNSNRGTALTYKSITATSNMTDGNFLGFSDAAYTDGQTAKIQVVGSIDDAQTGLTTGTKLFVQKNGSLATSADSPSVEAGIAVSDTKIIVKG